jgi:hypothetical protein
VIHLASVPAAICSAIFGTAAPSVAVAPGRGLLQAVSSATGVLDSLESTQIPVG